MASDYLSNFYAVAKQLTIPPKTILLEEGKVADKLYLVRKGCLRLFFYNEGKDITFQFFFEGNFVASFDSLYKRTPSLFYLESIEPTELAAIRREDFYSLFNRIAVFGMQVDSRKCTACQRCVRSCLMDCKRVGDRECIVCGKCRQSCPTEAISLGCKY